MSRTHNIMIILSCSGAPQGTYSRQTRTFNQLKLLFLLKISYTFRIHMHWYGALGCNGKNCLWSSKKHTNSYRFPNFSLPFQFWQFSMSSSIECALQVWSNWMTLKLHWLLPVQRNEQIAKMLVSNSQRKYLVSRSCLKRNHPAPLNGPPIPILPPTNASY